MRYIVYFHDHNFGNKIVDLVATDYNGIKSELERLFPDKSIFNIQHIEDESKLIKCKFCGTPEYIHWIDEVNEQLIKNQWCFNCNFWFEKVEYLKNNDKTFDGHQVIRIDGYHSIIHNVVKGDGRANFKYQLFNGEIIKCNNVTYQGDIPERFKEMLPDNAIKIIQPRVVLLWEGDRR